MHFQPLLLPAAVTLGKLSEARAVAFTSSSTRSVRQLWTKRSLPKASACGAASYSGLGASSRKNSSLQVLSKLTGATPYHSLLPSHQVCRGGFITREMATATESGGPSGGPKDLETAKQVVEFWFGDDLDRLATDKEYGQSFAAKWFGMGPPDEDFISTQNASKELIRKAASGELEGEEWESPQGALARLLLLDQFPRTAYRGTAQAFENDEIAASLSLELISKGWDTLEAKNYTFEQRLFVYLPLEHSERMEAQDMSVAKVKALVDEQTAATGSANPALNQYALDHRSVIAKFGRFPHRNAPLGRESTPEELEWLKSDDIPVWAKSQAVPPSN